MKKRTEYKTVGLLKTSSDKLKQIAEWQGRFQSEILKELIDRKFSSIKKISSECQKKW